MTSSTLPRLGALLPALFSLCLFVVGCSSSPEGSQAEPAEDEELSSLRAEADAEAQDAPERGKAWNQKQEAGHDHSGHDHSGHDHSGHDHSGHDHSGHDHSGHDHSAHSASTKAPKSGKAAKKDHDCECCEADAAKKKKAASE